MNEIKLATSATKEGITKLINDYFYSVNYTVNFETGEISGTKGKLKKYKVTNKKGRFIFWDVPD